MVVVLCTWLVWYVNSVVALLILDLLDFIVCSCFVRLVINAYDRLLIFMVCIGFRCWVFVVVVFVLSCLVCMLGLVIWFGLVVIVGCCMLD